MSPPTADRPADTTTAGGSTTADGGGKITRDAVLTAALEIIDRDGTDALSMRRLARALNRDPMILYRHAPNKAALLDGVAETVLAQLHVDSADPDWAGQLRDVARRYRALALAHPHVVPLIVTRPLVTATIGKTTYADMRRMEDLVRRSDLEWTIMRPSGLFDAPGATAYTRTRRPASSPAAPASRPACWTRRLTPGSCARRPRSRPPKAYPPWSR